MSDNLTLSPLQRWYPLIPHPVQTALVHDVSRFKVVPAGRRSGKTERAKRYLVKQALKNPNRNYFAAAPTLSQVKKIYWQDLKLLSLISKDSRTPILSTSETDLIIRLKNGSSIHLIGLDKPERFEGQLWHGGIIDEIANVKPNAWELNIRPALDTVNPLEPDYRAWAWLIGVPEGLNHYYDLCEYAKSGVDPDWKHYTWKSSDILPDDIIQAAKRQLSIVQFRQEYEASFETATGRIYSDYSPANYTTEVIKPTDPLVWMHDFNYSPASSAIGIIRQEKLYLLDEIVLESAVSQNVVAEFLERYKDHKSKSVIIFGDPAGQAGEKHGQLSNYSIIVNALRNAGWSVERKVKPAAPAIKDRQNAVRAKIKNANDEHSLYVNVQKCPYVHKGLSTVQFKQGSLFQEEESQYQHITTAIGYCVEYLWPVTLKKEEKKQVSVMKPIITHWK